MRDLGKVRKSSESTSPRVCYEFGPFRVDPLKRVLLRDGRPVELTGKAFDVLLALIQRGDEILTKEEIMQRVWPETVVEEGNLSRNISTLRKALGDTPEERQYIVTLAGRGYRFVGEVQERRLGDGADGESGRAQTPLEAARAQGKVTPLEGRITPFPAVPQPASQSGAHDGWHALRGGLALAAGGILVLVALLLWSLRSWRGGLFRTHSARAISREIATKLDPSAAAGVARPSPVNSEVYDLYFKGRYFWNQRTPEGLRTAASYFKQAIDLDPDYAPAYAGLADAYLLIALDYVPPSDFLAKAEAAANKAVALDGQSAEAHTALAAVKVIADWDWARAEQEFKRALEINPQYAPAHHWYATLYLAPVGRYQEAIAEVKRAVDLDPLSLICNTDLGWTLFAAGQYDRAIEQYRRTIEMDASYVPVHYRLSEAYEAKGMYREAIAECAGTQALLGNHDDEAKIKRVYATSGYRGYLVSGLKDFRQNPNGSRLSQAVFAFRLGNRHEALDLLRAAVERHEPALIYLKANPAFQSLHSDPNFQDLVRRVGLTP